MNKDVENSPLVSVLMTAYNREKYIAEAIESVLASTYKNFELIIVDDCSVDNTVKIARSYEAKDDRIKVYVNEKNLGQFPNRNRALSFARGEYIKYFDSDDIMKDFCLSLMVSAMQKYPEAMAGAEHFKPINRLPVLYNPRELYINHYFKGNNLLSVGPSAAIFRKEAFKEFGNFDEKIGILADTFLMLKIAAKYPFVGFQPETFIWRRHDDQVTVGQENIVEMTIQRRKINQDTLKNQNCPLNEKEKRILWRNLNNILVRNLVGYSIKGEFSIVSSIYKQSALTVRDFLRSYFPNKKILS